MDYIKEVTQKKDLLKILFVCSSNVCRSPYAEYTFRKMVEESPILKGKIEVASGAVVNHCAELHEKTRQVLLDEGWKAEEVDAHQPRHRKEHEELFAEADLIIAMSRFQVPFTPKRHRRPRGKFHLLSRLATGTYTQIKDPFLEKSYEGYKEVMEQIKKYLSLLIVRLEAEYR